MIRSCSIPPVLNRICDEKIHTAILVTTDGELMGSSTKYAHRVKDPEALGTLLADIGVDYVRLGEEYAGVDAVQRSKSHMQCLLMEMELGVVGVSCCAGLELLVIAVGDADVPLGMLKARLQALAGYVQESLSSLTETT